MINYLGTCEILLLLLLPVVAVPQWYVQIRTVGVFESMDWELLEKGSIPPPRFDRDLGFLHLVCEADGRDARCEEGDRELTNEEQDLFAIF